MSPPCTGSGAVERQTQLSVPFGVLRASSTPPKGLFLLSLLFGEWGACQVLSPSWGWEQQLQLVLVELERALLGIRDHHLHSRVTTTAHSHHSTLGVGNGVEQFFNSGQLYLILF